MSPGDQPAARLRLELSSRARRDVSDILLHSRKQWGADHKARFRDQFFRVLDRLCEYPELGRRQDDIYPEARAFPFRLHVIYYFHTALTLAVAGVMQGWQSPEG